MASPRLSRANAAWLPTAVCEASTPRITASGKSRMPSTFQTRIDLDGNGRLQYQATMGAVIPIAMSPHPADHANQP
jgi:hypothetical protein